MEEKLTPEMIKELCEKMGSRAALAARLDGLSDMAIRNWESGKVDVNKSGYRFEIKRLIEEYSVN